MQGSLKQQKLRIRKEISLLKQILGDDLNENGEQNTITSSYNSSGDRLNAYRTWLQSGTIQGTNGRGIAQIYSYIQEAYEKCRTTKERLEQERLAKENKLVKEDKYNKKKFKISKRSLNEFYNYQIENNLDFTSASKIPNDFSVNEAEFIKWFQDNVIIKKHGRVYVDTKYVYRINTNSAEKTASIDGALTLNKYQQILEEQKNVKQNSKRVYERTKSNFRLGRNDSVYDVQIRNTKLEETTRNTRTSEDSQNTRGSREGTLQEGVNSNLYIHSI